MKVVITGAAGLLGRHVAAACSDHGHQVTGIDTTPQTAGTWAKVTADLTDLGAAVQLFRGADAIIHCAAIPRPLGVAPAEVWRVNMATIHAAAEGAMLADIGLFIQASSFSVYGYPFASTLPVPQFLPLDESHPVAPQDIYGTTKWLGEELVDAMVRQGAFRAISLRMPWVQTPESFARDIPPRLASGAAAADLWAYIDARDAGEGFARALSWQGTGHLRCLLAAADSYAPDESRSLISAAFGDRTELRAPLAGHAGLIDSTLAQRAFGWQPEHSWRDYPAQEGRK